LHWYGKAESLPGRKLGHLTLALAEADPQRRLDEARSRLREVRRLWPLPPE
jgi:5-(carboxyamino)imidazole ribonucleotide synthase